MNKKSIALVICCIAQIGLAQDSPFTKFRNESCKIGLKDKKGKEILAADYRQIRVESIGNDWLISAQKNDRGTYLLYQNEKAIPLKYRELEKFNEQWIRVESEDKQGLISTTGKGIALIQYDYIRSVGNQYAVTTYQKKRGVIGATGEVILPNIFDDLIYWETADQFLVQKNSTWTRYDNKGKKLEGSYTAIGAAYDSPLYLAVGKEGKWGLIDRKGKVIVPIEYDGVGSFPNGWIKVSEGYNKWRLLDENLKPINENIYRNIYHLKLANCFSVSKDKGDDSQIGLLNDKGEEIVPIAYKMTLTTANGDIVILEKAPNSVHIYDNKNNKWLAKEAAGIQEVLVFSPEDNFFWIKQQGEWSLVDANLKPILEQKYKKVAANAGRYANITNDKNLVGLFSHQTQQLILPHEYTAIQVQEDIFKVKKVGTGWYFVNDKNERVECQW